MAWHRQQAQLQSAACSSTSLISTTGSNASSSSNSRSITIRSNSKNSGTRRIKTTGSGSANIKSRNSTRSSHVKQLQMFSGEKPFQCPICTKAFADKAICAHMYKHIA
uniref:C2H2-type domain-containing protein n=1 Tax=Loa loa TaxID=7209 RepID=A0A1I7VH02_LOALO